MSFLARPGLVAHDDLHRSKPDDLLGLRVELDFSWPGKPTDNAFIESLKFRSECLNVHWFLMLDGARLKMEEGRNDYNIVRPHSAIGDKPPISLMKVSSATPAT